MKNGTQPKKLLEAVKRARKRVISRPDLFSFAKGISNPDRAMKRLVQAGLVEKLERGVWLIPSGTRPNFDLPRFWSNPDLQDPLTISALVVSRPTVRDVARLVLAYGSSPAEQALSELEKSGEIGSGAAARSRRMLENTRRGFASVAG